MRMKMRCRQTIRYLDLCGWQPDLQLRVFGEFESLGDFNFTQLCSKHCLHFIEEGNGTFTADGRSFTAGAGDMYAFFPGQIIQYSDFPETPWKYTWCNLSGTRLEGIFEKLGITRRVPLMNVSANRLLQSVLKSIAEEVASKPQPPLIASTSAWRIVHALSSGNVSPGNKSGSRNLFKLCEDFMENRPDLNLTVDELADFAEVDRSTLFRAFKREAGVSPKEYIDERKFSTAQRLLTETGLSIKQVALASGFSNHAYFAEAFRKRLGKTPMEYRQARNDA